MSQNISKVIEHLINPGEKDSFEKLEGWQVNYFLVTNQKIFESEAVSIHVCYLQEWKQNKKSIFYI